jgi:hypothetical protein
VTELLKRLAFPTLVAVFGIAYWLSIRDMPLFARGFPQIVLLGLAVFTAASLVLELRGWFALRDADAGVDEAASAPVRNPDEHARGMTAGGELVVADDQSTDESLLWHPWTKTIVMLVLSALAVTGVLHVGWYTSFFVFFIVSFLYLRVRLVPTLPILVLGLMGLIYVLFDVILGLRLPGPTPLP